MTDHDRDKTPILLHPRIKEQMFTPGQTLFNDEKYYEAHEAWEKLWRMELDLEKTWLQGLIQVAGHYVLLQHHRYHAAYRMALHALEKLSVTLPKASLYRKFDTEPLYSALHYNMQLLAPHMRSYQGPDHGDQGENDWKDELRPNEPPPLQQIEVERFMFSKLFE